MVLGLNDIFHTLLHPIGKGWFSQWIASGVWRISKLTGHRGGQIAGPTAMVVAVVAWTLLQGLGWALIYLPHVPGGFSYSSDIDPGRYNAFAEALYISLVTLGTLGFGDVIPVEPWIRVFSPVQALTGFALLTAALSWFGQIYPALGRRRTLSIRVHLLEDNGYAETLREADTSTGNRVLGEVTASITQVRVDLTQNTETYYFRETDPRMSLAASMPYLQKLSVAARDSPVRDIRGDGELLRSALDDLARHFATQFGLSGDSTGEILDSFARDHGHAVQQES